MPMRGESYGGSCRTPVAVRGVYIFLLNTSFRVCSPAGGMRVVDTIVSTPPSRLKTSFDSSAIGPFGVSPMSLRVVITNFGPSQETRDLERKTSPLQIGAFAGVEFVDRRRCALADRAVDRDLRGRLSDGQRRRDVLAPPRPPPRPRPPAGAASLLAASKVHEPEKSVFACAQLGAAEATSAASATPTISACFMRILLRCGVGLFIRRPITLLLRSRDLHGLVAHRADSKTKQAAIRDP